MEDIVGKISSVEEGIKNIKEDISEIKDFNDTNLNYMVDMKTRIAVLEHKIDDIKNRRNSDLSEHRFKFGLYIVIVSSVVSAIVSVVGRILI
jgi:uncharacterized protein Yka (UPF0111/DUF47 family)